MATRRLRCARPWRDLTSRRWCSHRARRCADSSSSEAATRCRRSRSGRARRLPHARRDSRWSPRRRRLKSSSSRPQSSGLFQWRWAAMAEVISQPAVKTPEAARPRRLRSSPALRALVRETRLYPAQLIAPLFVISGRGQRHEIQSLKGHHRLTADLALQKAHELAELGVGGVLLFGIPDSKDAIESGADIVGPSAMMDGQVAALRSGLDGEGFVDTTIMAYASKHASTFYGPFRDAAGSTPS